MQPRREQIKNGAGGRKTFRRRLLNGDATMRERRQRVNKFAPEKPSRHGNRGRVIARLAPGALEQPQNNDDKQTTQQPPTAVTSFEVASNL
jgi:hypothetical protein